MIKAVFAVAYALLLPLSYAAAHGEGASFESIDNGYFVDVGYSAPSPLQGETVLFDFSLRRGSAAGEPVSFDSVWVKITAPSGAVVLATGVHNASFGGPRLTYAFPEEGAYDISVTFESEGDALAKGTYALSVAPSTSPRWIDASSMGVAGLLGVAVGVLGTFLYFIRRRRA